ncbi:protein phosphatase CheZ [bacterium]|nr:protein phosphatase CheZ [bacterium]
MENTSVDSAEDRESHSLLRVKQVSRELGESLARFDQGDLPVSCRAAINETAARAHILVSEIERFISNVVSDLELSEEELKKSSKKILTRVSEQLEKVTESTQMAVNSVLNRIDQICERQNTIFEQIVNLREKLSERKSESEPESMMEVLSRIENLENEIQGEAFEIMNEMQFQDITTQQIQLAQQLLEEAKQKLLDFRQIMTAFSEGASSNAREQMKAARTTFDPGATMKDRDIRQKLADDVSSDFKAPGGD